jgi:hypothetical protein
MQPIMSEQERLAAVEHDVYLAEPMLTGMIAYPQRSLAGGRHVQGPGLNAPALIGMLIDIAVIACKITSAMDL